MPAACALAAWIAALAADDAAHPVVAPLPTAPDPPVVTASESAPLPAVEPTEPHVEPHAAPLEPPATAPAATTPAATTPAATPVAQGYSAWNAARELPAEVAALEAEFTTRLGAGRDDYVWSGDALLPWVVVAPRGAVPEFVTLHRAREQLDVELLGPLDRRLSAATPVVVAWLDAVRFAALAGSMREKRCFAVTESDGAAARRVTGRTIEALTAASLGQLLGESAPRWWVEGAAAWLAADPATPLFAALPPDVPLAPLFRNDPGAPPAAGVAGAFTAWCLDPSGGGAHVRASWFETPRLRGAAEQLDELAARFGCAHFAELEQRWRSSRSH